MTGGSSFAHLKEAMAYYGTAGMFSFALRQEREEILQRDEVMLYGKV
jgi:hypothetical protein